MNKKEKNIMNIHNFRENIFILLVTLEFECGIYQTFARNFSESEKKIENIILNARENFCDHGIVNTNRCLIARRGISKNRINDLYFIYAGCCAFGN